VYFGIESADNGGAVWAVDAKWCRIAAEILLTGDPNHNFNFGKKGKLFDRYLRHRKNPTPLVYPVNAFRLNPRIAAQRGTFICSGDVTHTFYENLTGMKAKLDERIAKCQDIPGWTHEKIVNFESHSFLRKIIIGRGARRKILQELYRYNISFSSLYPDLEGFAKSLKTRISIPGSLPT
jgi:hypothetical protein